MREHALQPLGGADIHQLGFCLKHVCQSACGHVLVCLQVSACAHALVC